MTKPAGHGKPLPQQPTKPQQNLVAGHGKPIAAPTNKIQKAVVSTLSNGQTTSTYHQG